MEELTFEELKEDRDSYTQLIQDRDLNDVETEEKFWPIELPSGKKYKEKAFLFEIVANGFTGIDVDKMDYFARDARSVGLPNSFDWRRFTQTAKIIKCEDGFHHICSRDKDALSLYELFHTRNVLYRSVYRHKTVVIVEDLMKKALKEANHVICADGYPLLECWKSVDAFLTLNGTIEDRIGSLSPPNEAKKCFSRITERQLPKFVGHTLKKHKKDEDHEFYCEKAIEYVSSKRQKIDKSFLGSKEATFNYGKRGENPIMSHYFYNKEKPDGETPTPYKFEQEEVSLLLPAKFEETQLFWYYDVTEHDKECTRNNEAKTGSAIRESLLEYFTNVTKKEAKKADDLNFYKMCEL
uniref:Uncharacterized protein n=1 Tax=Amphimedon queenslandica TaxID=400682 RepID=A0A1X7SP16_AMPQE